MGLLSTIGAASGRAFGFTRSAIAAATDAFFNQVTLLLPGNGTNGAQNNTFLDSSTNNFTITRNGNTTQGTFSPFSQTGWGLRTSDRNYLTIPASSDFDIINTDYTIEFWFNLNAFNTMSGSGNNFFGNGLSTANNGWFMGFDGSGRTATSITFGVWNGGAFTSNVFSGLTLNMGTWYHIVLQRNGSGSNNLRLFVNGVQQGAAQTAVTYSTAAGAFAFGSGSYLQNINYSGNADYYISNVRLTKSAVYSTSGFTSPTSNLSQLAGTTLLICQSNRLINNGTNTGAITPTTVNVTPIQVVPYSPFAPTAAYDAAVVGGSAYFDGTGDYLVNSSMSPTITLGTSDFCMEGWAYFTSFNFGAYGAPIISFGGTGSQWMIRANKTTASTTSANYYFSNNGTFIPSAGFSSGVSGGTLYLNQWNHVAVVRQGSSFRLYVNGTLASTVTDSASMTAAISSLTIGADTSPGNGLMAGYIASTRLVVGDFVYSGSTISVPTAPFTSNANTRLLTNFTNAGITDATAKNDLETVGNAQISTTQSKWGGGSIYMDGTGDNLVVGPNPLLNFGLSDFTIEFWIYPTTFAGGISPMYSTLNRAKADVLAFDVNTGGSMAMYGTPLGGNVWTLFNANNVGTLTANTWQHVALVRSGSTWSAYLNGVRGAGFPVTNASALASIDGFNIGFNGAGGGYLNGYMDDIRISRYARYSGASFTPPTAAFALQ
jgi:hypothetical protein